MALHIGSAVQRLRDIAERQRVVAQSAELHERLELATKVASVGIWEQELSSNLVTWDDRMFEIYGIAPIARVPYTIWATAVHPDDLRAVESAEQAVIANRTQGTLEFRIIRPDGQTRTIYGVEGVVTDEQGIVTRVIGVNLDVTERRQAEAALRQSEVRYRMIADNVQDVIWAMDAQERFTYVSPSVERLSQCMAEALEMPFSGSLNERQARYVQAIRQSGERLLSMVNSLLRYTGVMANKVTIQQEPCRLADLCAVAVRAVRERATQQGQTITVSVESEGLAITSDADGIIQTIQQLLDNAVKFTPAGGPIGLEVRRDCNHDRVHLVVWDTGIGITAEQRAMIFQPFVHGDGGLGRRYGGVGLGLAYVQRLVELLGGAIDLESTPGEGSRFTVTLPIRNVTADLPEPRTKS